jgi:hypothetical protein
MNAELQEAIIGPSPTVKLNGVEYSLAYPMHAIILYQKGTAALDRERMQGRTPLSRKELAEMKANRRKLLHQARLTADLAPGEVVQESDELDALLEEATAIKRVLDEHAGTGDSLFDLDNWRKINPVEDPERMLLALWVGLHKFEGALYTPQLTKAELSPLIHIGNISDLTIAITKGLSQYIITPQDEDEVAEETNDEGLKEKEAPDPNALTPALPAQMKIVELDSPA